MMTQPPSQPSHMPAGLAHPPHSLQCQYVRVVSCYEDATSELCEHVIQATHICRSAFLCSTLHRGAWTYDRVGVPTLDLTSLRLPPTETVPSNRELTLWCGLMDLMDCPAHAVCPSTTGPLPGAAVGVAARGAASALVCAASIVDMAACIRAMQSTADVRSFYDRLTTAADSPVVYVEYSCVYPRPTVEPAVCALVDQRIGICASESLRLDVYDGRLHSDLNGVLSWDFITSRYIVRAVASAVSDLILTCDREGLPGLGWALTRFYQAHTALFHGFAFEGERTLDQLAHDVGFWTYCGVQDALLPCSLSGVSIFIPTPAGRCATIGRHAQQQQQQQQCQGALDVVTALGSCVPTRSAWHQCQPQLPLHHSLLSH